MPDQEPEPETPQAENDPVPDGTGPLRPGNATGEGGASGGNATGGRGPGASEAGILGIVILALYLTVFTLFVIYSLVKIWPVPTPSREKPPSATASLTPNSTPTVTPTATPTDTPVAGENPTTNPRAGSLSPTPTPTPSPSPGQPSQVTMLGWQFELWDEQRLLLLVILGGALGTLVHTMRSVYWYIGNRNLIKSWMAMYFMLPFAGAALALVFYLVVRGGFFSPQSSFQETSPFGFAAFAALIGMFSSQAVLKLKDVAEVLLSKPKGGADPKPQGTVPSAGATGSSTPPPTGSSGGGKTPAQG